MVNSNQDEQQGLVPVSRAELARAGAQALTARGRADLQKRDQAAEWLRKGLELQNAAWDDPEWLAVQEFPLIDEEPGPLFEAGGLLAKLIKGAEYVHAILAGEKPEKVASQLQMSHEDQELAHIAHFFMPSTLAEFRLPNTDTSGAAESIPSQLSSVPIPAGLKNGIPSEVMRERMARLHTGGAQAYAENKRLKQIRQRHEELLIEAFRYFESGLEVDPMNPALTYRLALAYLLGDGVQKDEWRAFAFFQRATEMGYAEAPGEIRFFHP